jgi:HEAT repeat protein
MRTMLLLATMGVVAAAQTSPAPSVSNAKFESIAFSGALESQMRSAEPAWFGYEVATYRIEQDTDYRGCTLENEQHGPRSRPAGSIQLEGSRRAALLFRVENNQVQKIRLYSLACPLDAGGRRFVWLTGVSVQSSLGFLESLASTQRPIGAGSEKSVQDGAIFAIAQHDAPAADDILERLTRATQATHVREQAVFWMGASRGARGLQTLKRLLKQDGSEQVRDKVVFALSISHEPDALASLIDAAQHDGSAHVRSQALFWLAQKAGAKAAGTIAYAIENDPDTAVKKQAVFAMSQLPKDDGVPRLIEIARTQRNPEIRKQAFFWLGQSNDPRAFAFIEQTLLK